MKLSLAAPRLLAGFGTLTLLAGLGLFASRPARTAGGPIAVSVANTPLATMPTDLAAPTQPFQHTFQAATDLKTSISKSIVVPAHKRLVIEYVSASIIEHPIGVGGTAYLATTADEETVTYYTVHNVQDSDKRSQSVRIYADPGTTVTVGAYSESLTAKAKGIGTDTEVSGYYVDVP